MKTAIYTWMVLFFIVSGVSGIRKRRTEVAHAQTHGRLRPPAYEIEHLRTFDPNFSRIVFEDFCYSLYSHVQHARGKRDLRRYAPYMSREVMSGIEKYDTAALKEVRGVIVGGIEIEEAILREDSTLVSVDVMYQANVTEVASEETSFYMRERWTFERQRDILSPPPAKAKADHCPRCGAALQTRTDGSCEFCGVTIEDGSFQWFVRRVAVHQRESRGPLLTSNVPEQGTTDRTRYQFDLRTRLQEFSRKHPAFSMEAFIARVREVAYELQNAWTARDWERVRPLETETLFQSHRYWIDAYIRQDLRNIVDDFNVEKIEPVKVQADAFYDAITARVFASGRDYTLDRSGNVVGGSRDQTRRWSEYWTFIRTRGTEADPTTTVSCPNCGASVAVGATGICSFCQGKLTGDDFVWILSRIEQDEAYPG